MFGRKKKVKPCAGCKQDIREDDENGVLLDLMWLRDSSDPMAGNPQIVRESSKLTLFLHHGCLANNIWLVLKYMQTVNNFSDVEITVHIDNKKIKYQVQPTEDGADWTIRPTIEGGRSLDFQGIYPNWDVEKVAKRIMEQRDVSMIIFKRNEIFSPPILLQNNNSLISDIVSSREHQELVRNAYTTYDKEHEELTNIADQAPVLFIQARLEFIANTIIRLDV